MQAVCVLLSLCFEQLGSKVENSLLIPFICVEIAKTPENYAFSGGAMKIPCKFPLLSENQRLLYVK